MVSTLLIAHILLSLRGRAPLSKKSAILTKTATPCWVYFRDDGTRSLLRQVLYFANSHIHQIAPDMATRIGLWAVSSSSMVSKMSSFRKPLSLFAVRPPARNGHVKKLAAQCSTPTHSLVHRTFVPSSLTRLPRLPQSSGAKRKIPSKSC